MVRQPNDDREQKDFLHRFQHQYSFCVPNFSEIISIEMKNFRARLGKRPGQEQGFLWGSYELCVLYRKFAGDEEITKEKVFSRRFSAFPAALPSFAAEALTANKISLTCHAANNAVVAPLFSAFFPLLERLDYLPFIIKVDVSGEIYSRPCSDPLREEGRGTEYFPKAAATRKTVTAAGNEAETAAAGIEIVAAGTETAAKEMAAVLKGSKTVGEEIKETAEKAEAGPERIQTVAIGCGPAINEMDIAVAGKAKTAINVTTAMERAGAVIPEAEAAATGMPDPVSMAPAAGEAETAAEIQLKKYLHTIRPMMGELFPAPKQGGKLVTRMENGPAKRGRPVPDPRYYQTYSLFYEYFYPELSAGKASQRKADEE